MPPSSNKLKSSGNASLNSNKTKGLFDFIIELVALYFGNFKMKGLIIRVLSFKSSQRKKKRHNRFYGNVVITRIY
jgi:hypothetical protein